MLIICNHFSINHLHEFYGPGRSGLNRLKDNLLLISSASSVGNQRFSLPCN